eukprot:569138-Pelagomonas_calceolata.AAC.1
MSAPCRLQPWHLTICGILILVEQTRVHVFPKGTFAGRFLQEGRHTCGRGQKYRQGLQPFIPFTPTFYPTGHFPTRKQTQLWAWSGM